MFLNSTCGSFEYLIKHLGFFFFFPFAALHEFPNDIFTNEDRRHGAVILHVLCVSFVTAFVFLSVWTGFGMFADS